MTGIDDLHREIQALRERISALSAASLRVGSSLDLDTVLREIAESARVLTAARYAVITTTDDEGELADVVLSGFTPEEERLLEAWNDGMKVFDALRDLPSPLRVADMPAYVGALGFSTDGVIIHTFQGTPMRHRDVQIGNFFLGEKEDGREFTDEDEELLVLFASQAAAAIANARTYRAERRVRADLEALVETSPFGVLVFRVPTGRPVSVNREARRLMEGLRSPGQSDEEVMRVVTCCFADGREIALDRFPLGRVLSDAQTVRAEEVVLSAPDGRSVTVLVNVTPIHASDGAVESVVVTVQDLAPLQEVERQRAEFLDMVSHELRAPLSAIKGSAATLVEASSSLDRAEMRAFSRIIVEHADHMRALISDLLDAGRIDSGTLSVAPEPTEVAALVDRARNTFLSGGSGHDVLIDLAPDLPPVMADRRRIVQVLNNLLANAARHARRALPHPHRGEPRREPCRDRRARRGPGHRVRAACTPVPQARPHRCRRCRARRRQRSRARHLQGAGGSAWRTHPRRERRSRPGRALHLHAPGCRGDPRQSAGEPAAGRAVAPFAPAEERPRILVVDDDPQALRFVRAALADAGYDALVTGDHHDLVALIDAERPHLVLLDLMLPDTDGIELMQRVSQLADQPVIFISAYGRDETIARALSSGAADYIVKPFSPTELVARIGAALRGRAEPEPFALGDLAIHYDERRVTVAGRPVELTATEFELLRALSLNAGRVMTYDALLRQVWGSRETRRHRPGARLHPEAPPQTGRRPEGAGLHLQPPGRRLSHGPKPRTVGDIGSHPMAPTPPEPAAAKLRGHRWCADNPSVMVEATLPAHTAESSFVPGDTDTADRRSVPPHVRGRARRLTSIRFRYAYGKVQARSIIIVEQLVRVNQSQ